MQRFSVTNDKKVLIVTEENGSQVAYLPSNLQTEIERLESQLSSQTLMFNKQIEERNKLLTEYQNIVRMMNN